MSQSGPVCGSHFFQGQDFSNHKVIMSFKKRGDHVTGKTGNSDVHFSRQGKNTRNLPKIKKHTGNLPPTQGKFEVLINSKNLPS